MKSALSCPAKLPLPGTVLHRGQREVKSPECTGKKAGEGCLKRPGPVLSHLLNTYMDTHTCTHTHTHKHTHTHTNTHTAVLPVPEKNFIAPMIAIGFNCKAHTHMISPMLSPLSVSL